MIDFTSWAQSVKAGLVVGLNEAAKEVERVAKQKAPIRRIFQGRRRSIRFKTAAEVQSERVLLMKLGIAPQFASLPSMRRPRVVSSFGRIYTSSPEDINRQYPGLRAARTRRGSPVMPGQLKLASAEALLSSRGRYEVRTMRAFYQGTVGGRLRGEIYTEPATSSSGRSTARVISPTRYAKYQEFGTRRHPAQPFLRPALSESQGAIASRMREALAEGVKSPLVSSGHLKVTLHL